MGLGGISVGSLVLILLVVLLVFGTKKIRNIGEDLGAGIKSFRKGLKEPDNSKPSDSPNEHNNQASQDEKQHVDQQ